MPKVIVKCDMCGITFIRDECKLKGKKHLFCSKQCLSDYSNKTKNPEGYKNLKDYTNISKHLSELNVKLNPTRMTPEIREKLSQSRRGYKLPYTRKSRTTTIKNDSNKKESKVLIRNPNSKSYYKLHGRHLHRIVAEEILGRPLKKGEVVHHIDGNIHNNSNDNLMIFKNQSEHAKWHSEHTPNWGVNKGGDKNL